MPGPVSCTVTVANSSSCRVVTVRVPDPSMACTALSMRFVQTWLSSAAYDGTGGSVRS